MPLARMVDAASRTKLAGINEELPNGHCSIRDDRLSLDTGDIDGEIFGRGRDLVYQAWPNLRVDLGYRDIDISVSSTNDDWRGQVEAQQGGPFLFIAASF